MGKDIKQTTDYSQFVVADWNRRINESNIKKIAKSVENKGWLRHPIMVDENFVVIDGQHRLEYAKRNKLPVYYVVVPNLSVQDCVVMNNARTSWSLADYINFYAIQGNPNYIILKAMAEDYYFIPVSILVSIVVESSQGGGVSQRIKNGDFEITAKEHDKAIAKLELLRSCKREILSVPGRASALFLAAAHAYDCEDVDTTRLQKQIQTYASLITPPANMDMALQEIEKVYNYRNNKGKYAYIYEDYKRKAMQKMVHKGKKVKNND